MFKLVSNTHWVGAGEMLKLVSNTHWVGAGEVFKLVSVDQHVLGWWAHIDKGCWKEGRKGFI